MSQQIGEPSEPTPPLQTQLNPDNDLQIENQLLQLKKLKKAIQSNITKNRLNYLETLQKTESAEIDQTVSSAIKNVSSKVKLEIENGHPINIQIYQAAVTGPINETLALKKSEKFEEEARKAKLRDIKRMKEEMEMKLASLAENEEFLSNSPFIQSKSIKSNKMKLQEEFEGKRQEAINFISKLKAEKRERKKRELERQKEEQEKLKKTLEEKNMENEQKNNELIKKRKEETMKTYQLLKQKRDEELKLFTERSLPLPPSNTYLYKKLEDKYQKEVLMPILEQKKQELAKKRNQCKSLQKEEIEDHIRKYDLLMAQKEEERKSEIQQRKMKEQKISENLKQLQTQIIEQTNQHDSQMKDELFKKKQEKHLLKEKMSSYSQLIKETVPVKINPQKTEQLQKQIEQLNHKPLQPRSVRKQYELATINKRNQSASHSVLPKSTKAETNEKSTQMIPRKSESSKHRMLLRKEEAHPQSTKPFQLDYLAELRVKREHNYKSSKPSTLNWMADLKNTSLNSSEKYSRLVGKANQIEEKAKMKEQLLQAKGGAEKNLEMGEYVSEMYLDAIKAKLSILENLQFGYL